MNLLEKEILYVNVRIKRKVNRLDLNKTVSLENTSSSFFLIIYIITYN